MSGSENLQDKPMRDYLHQGLRLVCANLPHLAGLAHAVDLHVDRRVPTAAISASGRLLANPDFFGVLDRRATTFVLAHELMHLALRTHQRGVGSDPYLVNCAHDYIINDILVQELRCPVPAGGLEMEGARHLSVEKLVSLMRSDPSLQAPSVWQQPKPGVGPPSGAPGLSGLGKILQDALSEAGALPESEPPTLPIDFPGDILSEEAERELFPDSQPQQIQERLREIRQIARKAESLGVLREKLGEIEQSELRGDAAGNSESLVQALRGSYLPPWDLALQRWLDAVAPGPRSFARPSRRGADRTDVILPGRKREGWTLHILLDTSGSMTNEIPRALGTIADYSDAMGVEQVHLLQCDTEVTSDEMISPSELSNYRVVGYGGSDMSPGMLHLADDLEVEAAIVITDGYIHYPSEPMPYSVLWVLPPWSSRRYFQPSYGHVLQMNPPRTSSE